MNQTETNQSNQPNQSHHDDDDDDVSFDHSMSTTELSEDAHQQRPVPKKRLISDVSFNDGVSRIKSHWKVLLMGQALSFFLALSGAMASSLYYECNISMPTLQAGLIYLFMSVHMISLFKSKQSTPKNRAKKPNRFVRKIFGRGQKENENDRRDGDIDPDDLALGKSISLDTTSFGPASASPHSLFGYIPLKVPWWVYFIIAFLSVEATYCITLAYRYTSFMSASLLDNFNIFAAMIGSKFFLKRRYSWKHVVGAIICILGGTLNVIGDYEKGQGDIDQSDKYAKLEATEYPHKMIGDFLAILGGILIGACDVAAEMMVKNFGGVNEYLGILGFFGFFITMIQAAIIERSDIAKFFSPDEVSKEQYEDYNNPYDAPRTCSQDDALLILFAYTIAGYLFQHGLSRFLKVSESALLTISILTADLWAALFTVFAQHIMPSYFFFIAFILVITGVIVYEMSPSPLGTAEDLQIHQDIELYDRSQDHLNLSNVSMSWESQDSEKKKQIV